MSSDSRDDQRAVRVRVSGDVQGVFFRASTRDRAQERDVSGWVRNDPEGTVTAVLEGAPEDVDALVEWMREGPPRAQVEQVDVTPTEPDGRDGFHVEH